MTELEVNVMNVLHKHDPHGLAQCSLDEYAPEARAIVEWASKDLSISIISEPEKYGDVVFAVFVLYFSRDSVRPMFDPIWNEVGKDLINVFRP